MRRSGRCGSVKRRGKLSAVRASKICLAWMLLLAAIVAPLADVAAFGIHEHITVPNRNGDDPTRDGSDAAPGHHCEFWMSPGALLIVAAPWPLEFLATLDVAMAAPRRSQTLSVPASPPRS